jgi:hypothetical protein
LPTISAMPWHRLFQAGGSITLYVMASCAQTPSTTASVTVPPVPAGEARAWFYRDEGPYGNNSLPQLFINGGLVEALQPRGAVYRDLPPGHYHVAVGNYLADANAAKDVDLAAGQQVYFKIVSNINWIGGGGQSADTGYSRPTYDVWLMPMGWAQSEVARSPFYGGS